MITLKSMRNTPPDAEPPLATGNIFILRANVLSAKESPLIGPTPSGQRPEAMST